MQRAALGYKKHSEAPTLLDLVHIYRPVHIYVVHIYVRQMCAGLWGVCTGLTQLTSRVRASPHSFTAIQGPADRRTRAPCTVRSVCARPNLKRQHVLH